MLAAWKKYYYRHQEQNIHAFKFALAFALGYSTYFLLHNFYSVAWILITIAVVMIAQPIVGQHILKSATRLLGTLIGAVLGSIAFHFLHNPVILLLLVVLIAFFLARFAVMKDPEIANIAVLGMVTFSLIVFVPHENLSFAYMRVLDIFIGISIALLVSRFVFPMDTRRALIFENIRSFDLMIQFIQKVYIEKLDRLNNPLVNQIDAAIVKCMAKQRAIIRSGRYESLGSQKLKNQFNQLVRYSRGLFNYLLFIDVALTEISENINVDSVYLRELLESPMKWITAVFDSFEVEQRVDGNKFDWVAYEKVVEGIKQLSRDQRFESSQSQVGAIIFALDRIPHCLRVLIQNWNDIQAN
jgi:uncharacterized membrane protein YgaE (UPF0421/DUF939 family)